jgi:enamine deaminase RidA (YjgF/YER057c/UK114 family)
LGHHLEHVDPPDVAPPRASYSHAIRSRGEVVWLAGQVATDAAGASVGVGDAPAQLRQVMANVGHALGAAGAAWSDVVRLVFYVVGRDNVEPVRSVRSELMRELFPEGRFPTSTFLVVDRLASEDFLVEVEATAVVG